MNLQFARELMEKTGFPAEAAAELLVHAEKLTGECFAPSFEALMDAYRECNFAARMLNDRVEALAGDAGMHPYTLWLLVLIESACRVKPLYESKGVSGQVFWDTFCDLKYKLWECRNNYGVWGNFVSFWYGIFFRAEIVKLGRLEYELDTYPMEEPYVCGDRVVRKGDMALSIHIPSSGEPFDREAVLDSLRKAHAFFGRDVLVCICDSWLLYPGYEDIWPENGNVRAFRDVFDIIHAGDYPDFSDGWRVYGSAWGCDSADLPEKSTMQRAFKQYILSGGKHGEGFGVLLFNGEKIINK